MGEGTGSGAPRHGWSGSLEGGDQPASVSPAHEPPATTAERDAVWTADHDTTTRDTTPAIGERGGPASWRPAVAGEPVALARPGFGDARWSFLYAPRDTEYAAASADPRHIADANRRMRASAVDQPHGPFIKPPVWTWEVPLYFWVGGLASGAAFVATACEAAGDERSARAARKIALAAVTLAPPLLIADLGRPARFLNMLRVFKVRSPMSMGSWCLVAFSTTAAGAVGADLLHRPRAAKRLGVATTLLGTYLGSYTGTLLSVTAVPLWARSRTTLGPLFICTATASGAAATRLALVAQGMPAVHPTQRALGHVETASIVAELALSRAHGRSLGNIGAVMHAGRPGVLFRLAETAVTAGVGTRLMSRWASPRVRDLASVLFLAGALTFRYAWMEAGKASATHDPSLVALGRGRQGQEDLTEVPAESRRITRPRRPLGPDTIKHVWGEAARRTSLAVEGVLQPRRRWRD